MIHESGEMYLETILILSYDIEKVHAVDIARKMDYSKASVSRGLSILKEKNFINIERGVITLTSAGREIAESIYQRHQVLTELFIKAGVDPEIAEDDACKIEHVISQETFTKLKEKYLS